MERYSTLWGTDKAGVYGRQGTSKRLGSFLTQKIGGSNVKDVVDVTEKILSGFKTLPGYERETLDNKPLAVVYAPMYLKNKPGMPSTMKGFCALSVNGMENRTGRKESNYSHTIFFPRQDMLSAGEYNYLDLLMGTYLLTCRDVKGHRDGTSRINFEQPPAKVSPVMRNQDMPCVVKAIETIYQNKNVVIALEEGVSFNRRAMELLTQLYAMMQPALATETGFATYQTVERITELSAETNVQVYVVPAGTDLSRLPAGKFEILDLAAGRIVPEQTPLAMTLLEWIKYDWNYRQSAMEHLFAKNPDYLNGDEFVRVSKQFFAQVQDLNTWLTDTSKHGTITTIEALQAEDKTQTTWKLVPWAKKAFESKCAALLPKGVALDALIAADLAAAYEYDGADQRVADLSKQTAVDPQARQKAIQNYQYGRRLAGASEAVLCQKIWEKAEARVSPGYKGEIAGLKKQNEDDAAAHKKAMEDKDAAHADELKAAEDAKTAAVAAVQTKLDDANTTITGLRTDLGTANTTITGLRTDLGTANETITGLRTDLGNANETITGLRTDLGTANETITGLRTDLGTANTTITGLKTDLDTANTTINKRDETIVGLNADLKTANANIAELKKEEAKLQGAVKVMDETITKGKGEIARLTELLEGKGIDITPPEPREETTAILGVKVPKSAMKIIAIFAAGAFLIGAILAGVIVGALSGGKDEPTGTTPPTTTAPVEITTAPTSEPTEPTTDPTEPVETTEAPTEPAAETALLDDGSIDWTYIEENVLWADAVETDPEAMEELLAGQEIDMSEWNLEAVITSLEWRAIGEADVTPDFVTVMKKAETGEAPAETTQINLTDLGSMVELAVMAGDRCVTAHFGYGEANEAARSETVMAALEIAGLVIPEDAELGFFAYALDDGSMVDLTGLLADADWRDVANISFDAQELADMQFTLGTAREPVSIVGISYSGDIAVYDYADDPDKAQTLVDLMTDKGHTAAVEGDFVLVLINEDALSGEDHP